MRNYYVLYIWWINCIYRFITCSGTRRTLQNEKPFADKQTKWITAYSVGRMRCHTPQWRHIHTHAFRFHTISPSCQRTVSMCTSTCFTQNVLHINCSLAAVRMCEPHWLNDWLSIRACGFYSWTYGACWMRSKLIHSTHRLRASRNVWKNEIMRGEWEPGPLGINKYTHETCMKLIRTKTCCCRFALNVDCRLTPHTWRRLVHNTYDGIWSTHTYHILRTEFVGI